MEVAPWYVDDGPQSQMRESMENYADGEDQFVRRKPVGGQDLSRKEIRSTLVCDSMFSPDRTDYGWAR